MKGNATITIELLAPAGNWDCLKQRLLMALMPYNFGIENFNARVRAENFQLDELPQIMS